MFMILMMLLKNTTWGWEKLLASLGTPVSLSDSLLVPAENTISY